MSRYGSNWNLFFGAQSYPALRNSRTSLNFRPELLERTMVYSAAMRDVITTSRKTIVERRDFNTMRNRYDAARCERRGPG